MLLPTQDKEAKMTSQEIINAVCGDCPFEMHFTDEQCRACQRQLEGIATAQVYKLEELGYYKGLPTSVEEALNSGDGAYRP